MTIRHGTGQSKYGPGVSIDLNGDEVALAIDAWLVAHGVVVRGPRTTTVNGDLCTRGEIYVDPSGFVITPDGQRVSGGPPVADPVAAFNATVQQMAAPFPGF